MSVGELLSGLMPLVAEPARNRQAIVDLLDQARGLAEGEVARFFVYQRTGGHVQGTLRSLDPRERLKGLQLVALCYPQAQAAQVLRRLVKDPDPRVRRRARKLVNAFALTDVALPDTRYNPPRWRQHTGPRRPGGWNPSGWAFGLYAERALRPGAIDGHGLPRLPDRQALIAWLGLPDEAALRRLMRPGTGPGAPYLEFEIDKRTGGRRLICAPKKPLKTIQRKLLDELLARLPVHEACHGFVPGRSTVTNAEPHRGAALVVKLDLVDFFPSIHFRRVEGFFASLGYNPEVARALAGLTTFRARFDDGYVAWPGNLPQGAPTSPMLANLLCERLDLRLSGLARKLSARYTRYADDLTFSFASAPRDLGRALWWIDQICSQEGFAQNAAKRRVLRSCNQQRVTGLVVNSSLSVPRAARRRFRAILHNCRQHGLQAQARGRSDFADYLRGFAAYVQMVQPALGRRLQAEVEDVIAHG